MSIILKGITWDHPRGYQPLVSCSALYEKEYGIKIEWYKRSLKAFGDQSLEELCNDFDLLIIDHPHVGIAEKKRCLEPLGNIIAEKDLSELSIQSAGPSYMSYNYKDVQWALPVDAAMQSAASRPDQLSEKNIPTTWDEVFELAKNLKKNNLYLGIALSPTDCLCSFLSLTAQAGSPIEEDNSKLVEIEVGLDVLEKLKKIKELFHPLSLEWTPIGLFDYMSSNDDVIYTPLAFCYNNYSRKHFRKKKLIFHDAPDIYNVVLGGTGISVSSSCKNKSIAGKFITWICKSEIQKTIYADEQGQPGNLLAWTDKKVNGLTNNFFFNTIKTLENAYFRPRYNGWTDFQTHLGNIVHDFLKYDKDPGEVLKKLDVSFQQSQIKK